MNRSNSLQKELLKRYYLISVIFKINLFNIHLYFLKNYPLPLYCFCRLLLKDEVDGVKVFKPTRNDKKIIKPFLLNKDNTGNVRNSFMQTKLNFNKHDESKSVGKYFNDF